MDENILEAPVEVPVSIVRGRSSVSLEIRFSIESAGKVTVEEMLEVMRVDQEVPVPKLSDSPSQAEADAWLENPVFTGKRFPCRIISRTVSPTNPDDCKLEVEPVSNEPSRGQTVTFWASLTVLQ